MILFNQIFSLVALEIQSFYHGLHIRGGLGELLEECMTFYCIISTGVITLKTIRFEFNLMYPPKLSIFAILRPGNES
jgi:hypothetical protein